MNTQQTKYVYNPKLYFCRNPKIKMEGEINGIYDPTNYLNAKPFPSIVFSNFFKDFTR